MNTPLLMKTNVNGIEIFDLSLTPKNASERGYIYIEDVNYDFFNLNNRLNDILNLVYKKGHKLGTPSRSYNFASFYGLYAPKNK